MSFDYITWLIWFIGFSIWAVWLYFSVKEFIIIIKKYKLEIKTINRNKEKFEKNKHS